MPIGFVAPSRTGTAVSISRDEGNIIEFISTLNANGDSQAGTDFHVALDVQLSFKRATSGAGATVAVTRDPDAPQVRLTEEQIRERFPWDYGELSQRLKARYIDFKLNKKYHEIRTQLKSDPNYVNQRYLDPGNPRSAKKDFFNSNVINEFDKHYTRKE